jgi:hypothetical protein
VLKRLKVKADKDMVQTKIYAENSVLQDCDAESQPRNMESSHTLGEDRPFGELKNINASKSSGNVYLLYGTLMKPTF